MDLPIYGRHTADRTQILIEREQQSLLLQELPHASNAHLALLYQQYMDNTGSGYWHDVMDEIQSRGLTLDDIESFLD